MILDSFPFSTIPRKRYSQEISNHSILDAIETFNYISIQTFNWKGWLGIYIDKDDLHFDLCISTSLI